MLAAQFIKIYEGGLYMAWYLPLLVLTIFRPNLEDRIASSAVIEGRNTWPVRFAQRWWKKEVRWLENGDWHPASCPLGLRAWVLRLSKCRNQPPFPDYFPGTGSERSFPRRVSTGSRLLCFRCQDFHARVSSP